MERSIQSYRSLGWKFRYSKTTLLLFTQSIDTQCRDNEISFGDNKSIREPFIRSLRSRTYLSNYVCIFGNGLICYSYSRPIDRRSKADCNNSRQICSDRNVRGECVSGRDMAGSSFMHSVATHKFFRTAKDRLFRRIFSPFSLSFFLFFFNSFFSVEIFFFFLSIERATRST